MPCPSSRFVLQYQDSAGRCIPGFHTSARVYAIRANNPSDTLYSYTFSDSCKVGILVQENLVYHIVGSNPTVRDIIKITSYDFQEPVEMTECCLCYPVKSITGTLNSQALTATFTEGKFENAPFIRTIQ